MTAIEMVPPADSFDFHEGDRIRKARESRDLNQAQLAELACLSRASIQNYEAGARVSRASRRLIGMALAVSEAWLETGVTPPDDERPRQDSDLRPSAYKAAGLRLIGTPERRRTPRGLRVADRPGPRVGDGRELAAVA